MLVIAFGSERPQLLPLQALLDPDLGKVAECCLPTVHTDPEGTTGHIRPDNVDNVLGFSSPSSGTPSI